LGSLVEQISEIFSVLPNSNQVAYQKEAGEFDVREALLLASCPAGFFLFA
jgi:hypothetical protein